MVREVGPLVYGYSVTLGPDGKPVIREFGNMKPGLPGRRPGRPSLDVKDRREPLVDIISQNDELKVIAEVPGVEKKDIRLTATSNSLAIDASTPERKYFKEIELPSEVDPQSAKSIYNNGILEVKFKTIKKGPKGQQISIE